MGVTGVFIGVGHADEKEGIDDGDSETDVLAAVREEEGVLEGPLPPLSTLLAISARLKWILERKRPMSVVDKTYLRSMSSSRSSS
jgi:hypothetical protein